MLDLIGHLHSCSHVLGLRVGCLELLDRGLLVTVLRGLRVYVRCGGLRHSDVVLHDVRSPWCRFARAVPPFGVCGFGV